MSRARTMAEARPSRPLYEPRIVLGKRERRCYGRYCGCRNRVNCWAPPGSVRCQTSAAVVGGGISKMKKVFIIGIGAGNPDYITVQAINALNEVDVFFVMDKGREKNDLVRLRKSICERYIKNKSYRTIEVPDPERD